MNCPISTWSFAAGALILVAHFLRTSARAADPDQPAPTLSNLAITSCEFSLDGKYLLTAAGRQVHHWDLASGKLIQELEGHLEKVHVVRISDDGLSALTGAGGEWDMGIIPKDMTARYWSLIPAVASRYFVHSSFVRAADFGSNCKIFTVAKGGPAPLTVWDMKTGCKLFSHDLTTSYGHRDTNIRALAPASFSPDGSMVAGMTRDTEGSRITFWDSTSGKELLKTPGQRRGFSGIVFNKAGELILTSSDDQTAKIWSSTTGELIQSFSGHQGPVYSAVFQQDNKRIVTASDDRTARIWDAQTGKELFRLEHSNRVNYALLSDNGTRILTKSAAPNSPHRLKFRATLWDANNGEEIKSFDLRENSEVAIFAPGGKEVLLTLEKTALVNAATGETLKEFN